MQAGEREVVFRKASPWEKRLLRKTLADSFGEEALNVLRGGEIYAVEAYWVELHLLGAEVEKLTGIIGRLGRHPYSAGLFLGWVRRGSFTPSLPLIQLIVGIAERGVVYVSEKAGMLFLYGRDILCSSVLRVKGGKPRRRQLVIVANKRGEALGLGVFEKKGSVCVENKLDLGWYLRRAG